MNTIEIILTKMGLGVGMVIANAAAIESNFRKVFGIALDLHTEERDNHVIVTIETAKDKLTIDYELKPTTFGFVIKQFECVYQTKD